jgi:KipI family sensor histidine kinase inhibitor
MIDPRFFEVLPSALLVTLGDRIDPSLIRRIARFRQWIRESFRDGIRDAIPSYTTILILYDPGVTSVRTLSTELSFGWKHLEDEEFGQESDIATISVVYGDEFGEDLAEVSRRSGLSVEDAIARHAGATYTVGALGFAPGFTYLAGLPPELATPRRDRPRLRVPEGSVGIGGEQTGIYALPTSGGWNLIGRTPEQLFDPSADPPVWLRMGDQVRFRPIPAHQWVEPVVSQSRDLDPDGPIEVIVPGMQTTVQDLGRVGYGDIGFSPNGAADRRSLIAANRAVGNPDNAPALEMTFTGPQLRFDRRLTIAVSGADLGPILNGLPLPLGRPQDVMPGDELTFVRPEGSRGMRAYLSIAGGIDVPLVMGSASTDLTAGIGGYRGRALRTGDRIPVSRRESDAPGRVVQTYRHDDRPLRVLPGPQRDRFPDETWNLLLARDFTVSSEANRVGVRLVGPSLRPIDGADIISEGIVTGSIQITGEGQPIVMLPGHATIGGYTKVATVIEEDWDRLGQLTPGDTVRFREA